MLDTTTHTLGEVTVNHDSRRIPVKAADRRPGPFPYYGASGVVDYVDGYIFDGEYLLVAEDGENLRTRKTPIAFMANGKFWVNNHAHVLTGNFLANTRYLCYLLASTDVSGFLSGSTQPKLTQAALNSIPLRLPSRVYQDSVIDVLGALDDKIAVNQQIAQTLRELGTAMFRRAVDLCGEEVTVASLAQVISRGVAPKYTNDEAELLVLNQKCVREGRVTLVPARRTLTAKVQPAKRLQKYDVLINSTGVGTLGRVARWTGRSEATVDSHITIVRFDQSRVDQLCASFAMLAAQPEIERLGEGSTGQTELSRTKVGELSLRLPGRTVQEKLSGELESLEARGDAALAECDSLAKLRDSLLPGLMSGAIRVRDAEKAVEDAT